MDENVKVKAKFKQTSRRFEIASSTTWSDLVLQLCSLFSIQDNLRIHVRYRDDENELVSISSQVELDEAIRLTKLSSRLLYLYIDDQPSQQMTDQTHLSLEEIHADVKEQEQKKGKSSPYHSDLASMAEELSALNKRLEKSAAKNPAMKEDFKKQNNKAMDDKMKNDDASPLPKSPELSTTNEKLPKTQQRETGKSPGQKTTEKKERKDKEGSASCYSELASAIAADLSSMNERMSKKDREVQKAPQQIQQDKKENPKEKNRGASCYSELATAIAPELSSLNEKMDKREKETQKPTKVKRSQQDKKENPKEENNGGSCYSELAGAVAPERSSIDERMTKKEKQTQKTTKVKQPQQDKKEKRKEKDNSSSCYSELAAAIAPELSSLNERMAKKENETRKQAKTPSSSDDSIPPPPEQPRSCYINLEEMMAQSRNMDCSVILNSSNSTEEPREASQSSEMGASRGWFDHFGEQQAKSATKKEKTTKKAKKQDCYNELAESVACDLRNLTIIENETTVKSKKDDSLTTSNDRVVEEPCYVPMNINQEAKRQLDGQCGKKPKRSKKHNKSKKCYAEMADDISCMFQAMNKRLEEKQQMEAASEMTKEPDVASLSSSPESFGEPFVFVGNTDELQSIQYSSMEFVSSETTDEPSRYGSNSEVEVQCPEQRLYTEPNLISFDESNPQDAPAMQSCEASNPTPSATTRQGDAKVECDMTDHTLVDDTKDTPETTSCELLREVPLTSVSQQDEVENVQQDCARLSCDSIPQSPGKTQDMKEIVKELLEESMDSIIVKAVERLKTPNTNTPTTPCNTPQGNATPLGIVVHKGITCDNCGMEVHGIRYKCCNCKDYDLCETCEDMTGIHNMEHVFVKLRYPSPGIGRRHGEMVPIFKKSVYKRRCEKKQKERELRRAAREADKERRRALKEQKHALKAKEKERKKKEKAKLKTRQDNQRTEKLEISTVYDRLKAVFVCDANYPDGTLVQPGQKFNKTWVIENGGDIAWNQWITLACIEGSIMGFPIPVPFLKPGAQDEVSVDFVAPEIPGTYTSKWQLCYGLHMFGPMLWCEIQVPDRKELEEAEAPIHHDHQSLVDTAFKTETFTEPEVKLIQENNQQMEAEDDGSSSEYLSPEESPEGDSFSLSSSPDTKKEISLTSVASVQHRQDLEWDAGCTHDLEVVKVEADNAHLLREVTSNIENWSLSDDSDGEESDSSLDEFTVLVPTCFDPDAPLTAEPFPVKVTDYKSSKSSNSISSPFFNSLAAVDPAYNNYEPSSLPNMSLSNKDDDRSADYDTTAINEQTTAPIVDKPSQDYPQSEDSTPSGSLHCVPTPEPVLRDTPVSTQPSISPEGGIPLITQPTTVIATAQENEKSDSNIVSDVFNTAVDVVTSAGRAAMATVDNLFNVSSQTTATYAPQGDKVTLHPRGSNMDAPPPPPLVWPINRSPSTSSMDRLIEMGFCDRRLNQRLLHKHKDDINSTIEELLGHQENDWSAQRH